MGTRTKKQVIANVTREEMEQSFANFAKADAKQQKITAEMDLQIAKIREKYADELETLQEEKDTAFDVMQTYAEENKDELFIKKKSLDLAHGTIGFRTGTPKLKTIKKFTWGACLELVKEFLPSYVRTSEEIAKDKILADRENEDVADNMQRCGMQVVQDETFYVECKKEEAG